MQIQKGLERPGHPGFKGLGRLGFRVMGSHWVYVFGSRVMVFVSFGCEVFGGFGV